MTSVAKSANISSEIIRPPMNRRSQETQRNLQQRVGREANHRHRGSRLNSLLITSKFFEMCRSASSLRCADLPKENGGRRLHWRRCINRRVHRELRGRYPSPCLPHILILMVLRELLSRCGCVKRWLAPSAAVEGGKGGEEEKEGGPGGAAGGLSRCSSSQASLCTQASSSPTSEYTLVLDLDETLMHATKQQMANHSLKVRVTVGERSADFWVATRPFLNFFMEEMRPHFSIWIYTAGREEYARAMLETLNISHLIAHVLSRSSCVPTATGHFVKELTVVKQDLSKVILVDDSPVAYSRHPSNAVPINGWFGSAQDTALRDLVPLLLALRKVRDVRSILKLRNLSRQDVSQLFKGAGREDFVAIAQPSPSRLPTAPVRNPPTDLKLHRRLRGSTGAFQRRATPCSSQPSIQPCGDVGDTPAGPGASPCGVSANDSIHKSWGLEDATSSSAGVPSSHGTAVSGGAHAHAQGRVQNSGSSLETDGAGGACRHRVSRGREEEIRGSVDRTPRQGRERERQMERCEIDLFWRSGASSHEKEREREGGAGETERCLLTTSVCREGGICRATVRPTGGFVSEDLCGDGKAERGASSSSSSVKKAPSSSSSSSGVFPFFDKILQGFGRRPSVERRQEGGENAKAKARGRGLQGGSSGSEGLRERRPPPIENPVWDLNGDKERDRGGNISSFRPPTPLLSFSSSPSSFPSGDASPFIPAAPSSSAYDANMNINEPQPISGRVWTFSPLPPSIPSVSPPHRHPNNQRDGGETSQQPQQGKASAGQRSSRQREKEKERGRPPSASASRKPPHSPPLSKPRMSPSARNTPLRKISGNDLYAVPADSSHSRQRVRKDSDVEERGVGVHGGENSKSQNGLTSSSTSPPCPSSNIQRRRMESVRGPDEIVTEVMNNSLNGMSSVARSLSHSGSPITPPPLSSTLSRRNRQKHEQEEEDEEDRERASASSSFTLSSPSLLTSSSTSQSREHCKEAAAQNERSGYERRGRSSLCFSRETANSFPVAPDSPSVPPSSSSFPAPPPYTGGIKWGEPGGGGDGPPSWAACSDRLFDHKGQSSPPQVTAVIPAEGDIDRDADSGTDLSGNAGAGGTLCGKARHSCNVTSMGVKEKGAKVGQVDAARGAVGFPPEEEKEMGGFCRGLGSGYSTDARTPEW
uniref:FCP1 homology domain-containing protein n=1 Tax=Chromera velia CCMP2878 TaxID=1169474 RepID=A0A0G4HY77_9ALVE|eukprot:Cvel_9431.t1-p1 / transcript=Cvel_9431.t1 / gene=Cvel_9431 / organism=Chromera_velia_CCMP2878 / gene_product=CTD nuclear envelope phosphatase 1 homolog, putative / transcript_product=CTD nuclear envelope phosphatase 1 homolog, putative / location=Cvel_scaffold543:57668-63321(+) / protein_length=1159 / sequence_SO=supercontig / SO=protein_coding / is_pseudo=false